MEGVSSLDATDDGLLRAVASVAGHRVLDRLILLRRVGAGGMGFVYLAWHLDYGFEVAVKILKPALAVDSEYVERFRREAQVAMTITHQNVVRVFAVGCAHELHYIVMEFVDGETAPARVSRWGHMRRGEAVTMLTGMAAGLAEVHFRGAVHRDIKPDNVMIARDGRVKLADMGLARFAVDERGMTIVGNTSVIMGTPQYMSPEQWETPNVRAPADVWAIGATFYYLLTGEHAVPQGSPGQLARWIHDNDLPSLRERLPDLPAELHEIYERCVKRRPEDRFSSAGELLVALQQLGMADDQLLKVESSATHETVSQAVERPSELVIERIRHASMVSTEPRRVRRSPRPARMNRLLRTWASVLAVSVLAVVAWRVVAGRLDNLTASANTLNKQNGQPDMADSSAGLLRQADRARASGDALAEREALIRAESMGDEEAANRRRVFDRERALQLRAALLRCLRPSVALRQDRPTWINQRELLVSLLDPPASLSKVTCGLLRMQEGENLDGARDRFARAINVTAANVAMAARLIVDSDGSYWVIALGTDEVGVESQEILGQLICDTVAPHVRLIEPASGAAVGREARICVECSADTQRVAFVVDGEMKAARRDGESRQFSWRGTLRDAVAEVSAQALDEAGNVGSASWRIPIDDEAPSLVIDVVPDIVNTPTLRLTGLAAGAQRVLATVEQITVEADVDASGRFAVVASLPVDESYELTLVASDAVGNRSEPVVRSVRRYSQKPVLAWQSPELIKRVPDGLVTIQVSAASRIPIVSVICNGVDATRVNDAWITSVNVSGTTSVELVATDAAGNVETRIFTMNAELEGSVLVTACGVVMRPIPRGDLPRPGIPKIGMSAFWIANTEVTREQWLAVGLKALPAWQRGDERLPVEVVTWQQAREFCTLLQQAEDRLGRLPQGYRCDLPTEAQWEYACRAGNDAAWFFGDDASQLSKYAVFDMDAASIVGGGRIANKWGLFDMHGNVEEWCQDMLDFARAPSRLDPMGSFGGEVAVRGGSYQSLSSETKSDACLPVEPLSARRGIGFRPAYILE